MSVTLDNNLRSRSSAALGRKNHHGSRSKRSTEVAAVFCSLLETAKWIGEEPGAYLVRAIRAALDSPGTVALPAVPGT